MLTEQEVAQIWARQWAKVKPFMEGQNHDHYEAHLKPNSKGEVPELWPGFGAAYFQREDLLPHIEHGVFPDRLFHERAPNQSEAEWNYIKKNYRQTTLPVYLDTENTIGRAIHKGNYAIEWEQGSAITDAVRDYVERGIQEWGSVSAFVQRMLIRLKMEDAMGVLGFLPREVPTMTTEEGTEVVDPNGEIQPGIHYFRCSQVWGFEYDRYYLLRLNSDSDVTWGRQDVPGVACILVDDTAVWTITQTGKKSDWRFEIVRAYEHGASEPPCIHLGGVPVVRGGSLAFESPFLAAKENLDIALQNTQWLQASFVKTNYPQVVMVGDPCDFYDEGTGQRCFEGKINYTNEQGAEIVKSCPSCKGTGKMRRLGPLNELIINPKTSPDGIGPADGVNATNALTYIVPPEHAFTSNRSWIEYNIQQARSILHLNADGPMAGGDSKTATEAGLNNRAKDAFVKPIADQILRIEAFAITMIGRQIAGSEWDGFSLRLPTQYDLRTEADRVAEITIARDAGIPPAIIDEMEGDLIAARYAGDEYMTEAMEVVQLSDRLARMSESTILAEAAAGRAQPWEVLLHYASLDLYRELYDTDAAFVRSELWDKVKRMHDKARERAGSAASSPTLSILRDVIRA